MTNPHNEMPKDTVEEMMELIAIGQVTRKDIEGVLHTAYNKGVEVGRVEVEKILISMSWQQKNETSEAIRVLHEIREALTSLPEDKP